MIGLSNKTIYAMAALYQLSLLKSAERLKIREIAERADAPQKFLEQILLELKKNGVLNSTKGANGGYILAKPMDKITLKEIISILENNAFDEMCQTDNEVLKMFWEEKQKEIVKILDTPLSILNTYQEKINKNFNYII
jgi:Rrf2 family protein